MFESFLLQLAKVLQLPTLAPDHAGACLIQMREEKIALLFELDEQLVPHKILVSTPVIPFPIERRAEIYESCLKMNETHEGTLSVKPDEDLIYFHRRLSPQIEAKELERVVEALLKQVAEMQEHVQTLLQRAPRRPTIPPPPSSIQIYPFKA